MKLSYKPMIKKGRYYFEINNNEDIKEFLVSFYREQHSYFLRVGIGNSTKYKTKVTKTLILATANRLDQLITGKVTNKNRNRGRCKTYVPSEERALYNYSSNRSFGWNKTSLMNSQFRCSDLDFEQRYSIDYPTIIQETYIDKYTTAYNAIREYKEYE